MNKFIKQAFTLIELLVVIAIIGILSGLIVVSMGGMTTKATIAKAQVFSNSLRNSLMMNLVGEWKFDGLTSDGVAATANDVLDSWGGVNNGTLSATPPIVKTGSNCINGSCLQFDGSSNYVDFGNGANLQMKSNDFTLAAWVKTNTGAGYPPIIAKARGTTYYGYDLYINIYGQLVSGISDGTNQFYMTGSTNICNNNWHYIVAVIKRDSNNNNQIYIDGKNESVSYTGTVTSVPSLDITYNLRLAKYIIDSRWFNGLIDDVRIYNAAIPTSQIKEQYYLGLNSLLANGNISKEEYNKRLINSLASK